MAIFHEPVPSEICALHFAPIKVIGKGGFSRVIEGKLNLARKKDTGKLYAIKIMTKEFILSEDKAT